jgi:hypothetical protein
MTSALQSFQALVCGTRGRYDEVMEQSGGTFARVMVVFLAVGIGAAGLYAFQNYRTSARLEAERNDIQGKLASCTKSQDDEKRAREATEKDRHCDHRRFERVRAPSSTSCAGRRKRRTSASPSSARSRRSSAR